MIPEPVARRYEAVIARILRRYVNHPDYEDLLADARFAALRVLAQMAEEDRVNADRIVVTVALKEMRHFFRTNRLRTYTASGRPVPKVVSLEGLDEAVPDFSEAIIHQEWCRWVWQEAEKRTTPRRLEVLREFATKGALAHHQGAGYTSFSNAKQRAISDLRRFFLAPKGSR